MSGDQVLGEFGVDKHGLVDNFREATEAALSRANLLQTTRLETLQAFVMYLVGHRVSFSSSNVPCPYGISPFDFRVTNIIMTDSAL
jgi:hypothetical protein